jgi:hypothetical protein
LSLVTQKVQSSPLKFKALRAARLGHLCSGVGVTLNKGYPAQEIFIEDENGKKVFLYTEGPRGEGSIFVELIEPWYDQIGILNFAIEIDQNGNFKDEIIIRSSSSFAYSNFELQANTPGRRSGLMASNKRIFLDLRGGPTGNQVSFNSNTLSIIDWNQLNLNKDPADDCTSIPCCGQDGCCDE